MKHLSQSVSESSGPFGDHRLSWAYPALFAIFPAASMYARNIRQVPLEQFLLIACSIIGVVLLVQLLLVALLRQPHRVAVALSLVVALFYLGERSVLICIDRFGLEYLEALSLIPAFTMWSPKFTTKLAVWMLAALLLGTLLGRACNPSPRATLGLTRIAALGIVIPFLLKLPLISVLLHERRAEAIETGTSTAAVAESASLPPLPPPLRPNIFYILADEYAREDVLRAKYDFDNAPFLDALRKRGFVDAAQSVANYSFTYMALPALVSMDYVPSQLSPPRTINRMLNAGGEAPLFEDLERSGYRVHLLPYRIHLPSTERYFVLPHKGQWQRLIESDYFDLLFAATPVAYLRGWIAELRAEVPPSYHFTMSQFDQIRRLAREPGSVFVFAHLAHPHRPFVFKADGSPWPMSYVAEIGPDRRRSESEMLLFRKLYADQIAGLNAHLIRLVDDILEASTSPPIIIIQADHGPRPANWARLGNGMNHWELYHEGLVDLREWMGILSVAHLPGHADRFYPTISPVNTLRLVLSTYLDFDLPLLEDRAFFISEWIGESMEFEDITDLVNAAPQPKS
jgi:hypothetical protein